MYKIFKLTNICTINTQIKFCKTKYLRNVGKDNSLRSTSVVRVIIFSIDIFKTYSFIIEL